MKRGQLTLFVIISLVIVFLIMISFLFQNRLRHEPVDNQIKPIYNIVNLCIEEVTEDSINIIGESGGYYNPPNKSNLNSIAYYFYEGENLMPSLEEIENQMENYVSDMVFFCVQRNLLELPDYEFYSGEINVEANINTNDHVFFNVKYPFIVKINNNTYYFNQPFLTSYDVRLYSLYEFVKETIALHEEEPRAFCVNCITDLAYDYNFYVDLIDAEPNDVIFMISDEKSIIKEDSFSFFFVVKYPTESYDPYEEMFK
jgi:hypothetical protein